MAQPENTLKAKLLLSSALLWRCPASAALARFLLRLINAVSMSPRSQMYHRMTQIDDYLKKSRLRKHRPALWSTTCLMLCLLVAGAIGCIPVVRALGNASVDANDPDIPTLVESTVPVFATTDPGDAPALPAQPALSVRGTQIVDAQGNLVTLIGAARDSLEYWCSGDGHFERADFAAMRAWGMNVVRIPLSSAFWPNLNGTCPNYVQTVTQAVANAEAEGLYVILSLHRNAPLDLPDDAISGGGQYPMPDSGRDLTFWEDIARLYRSDPAVIFDLFDEPHDVSWYTWYHGGTVSTQAYAGGQPAAGGGTYQAIGMRDLVAKIRAIAPSNLITISGLDWGYNLAGIGWGYAIQGSNILYSTHPYNYASKAPGDWPGAFGDLIGQVPIISTEFGSYGCQTSYVSQVIAYFEAHRISWIAWGWSPSNCNGPSLIANWSGAPTTPYGAYIRQQMLKATLGDEVRQVKR